MNNNFIIVHNFNCDQELAYVGDSFIPEIICQFPPTLEELLNHIEINVYYGENAESHGGFTVFLQLNEGEYFHPNDQIVIKQSGILYISTENERIINKDIYVPNSNAIMSNFPIVRSYKNKYLKIACSSVEIFMQEKIHPSFATALSKISPQINKNENFGEIYYVGKQFEIFNEEHKALCLIESNIPKLYLTKENGEEVFYDEI